MHSVERPESPRAPFPSAGPAAAGPQGRGLLPGSGPHGCHRVTSAVGHGRGGLTRGPAPGRPETSRARSLRPGGPSCLAHVHVQPGKSRPRHRGRTRSPCSLNLREEGPPTPSVRRSHDIVASITSGFISRYFPPQHWVERQFALLRPSSDERGDGRNHLCEGPFRCTCVGTGAICGVFA